ncbi:replication initiation protein RepC [Allosediminivita pacifica]|nr:replication initiation protein RepC [Allosediminivita pacifica]
MQAAHLYSVAPSEPRQPILPTGMERDGFVALVDTIAPLLGVGNAALSTFRVMIAMTKPRAFKDGSQEPCCYASQCEIAHKRMVNPSRIRAHERELEAAGLIERRTMANGARSGFAGCGVYFTRAIARVHDFLAMRDQLEVDRRTHTTLRGLRSVHKRHIKAALSDLIDALGVTAEVQAIIEAYQGWPDADALHRLSLADLEAHVEEADKLCTSAYDLLSNVLESSGGPVENERSYIQDTSQDPNPVTCNAHAIMRSAGKPAHSDSVDAPPTGGASCNEKEDRRGATERNTEYLAKLTPQQLYRLCSEEMQLYIDGRVGAGYPFDLRAFEIAAEMRVPELGISPSAWAKARDELQGGAATLAVLIIDAKTSGPRPQIKSPGGYLRGMIAKHREGSLNLVGGLIGLSTRCHANPGTYP